MKLQPLFNNVIVKPFKPEEVTKSGLVLPETREKDRPEKGEVIACGPGKTLDNGQVLTMSVKVGDQVLFKKYSADEIKIDNEEYLVLSESDIVAVIN
ncbi:MAG: co-chaperone GroES [Patescibacteria group bacterium]|jgi:chaperonin GroES|nr:co-chaperone GroES [bacterium]HQC49789.1 co-chaperone GroES [bacterium]